MSDPRLTVVRERVQQARLSLGKWFEEAAGQDLQDLAYLLSQYGSLMDLALALDKMCAAYRIGGRPSSATLDTLLRLRPMLEEQ